MFWRLEFWTTTHSYLKSHIYFTAYKTTRTFLFLDSYRRYPRYNNRLVLRYLDDYSAIDVVQFRIERLSTVNAAGHRRDNCRLHQFYVHLSRCDFVPWTRLDCIIVHCTRDEFPWRARRTCSSLSTTKWSELRARLSESQSMHFFH